MKLFTATPALAAACLALLTAFPAAAAEPAIKLPEAIRAKGQLKVGINGIFPPMEFKNPGAEDLIGFDVELAQAIGTTLNVKVVFDDQKFDQLLASVTTGRVDFVISGLSDSAARRKTYDFIDYFNSGTQAFTVKANAKTITGLEALSGKTLAISASTDYMATLQKWSKDNLEAKGKPGIQFLPVDSEATSRLQMVQGRAQASAISPEVFGWMEKQTPGQFVPIGPILAPDPYGICFKKDQAELRDAVAEALKRLLKNGTYKKILAKWEVSRSGVPEVLVNGEKKP